MLTALVIAIILSIQLVSAMPGTEEKCLEGVHHKMFPSPETGFATCFPWQNESCCSAEVTVDLMERGEKDISHFDWDYCGGLSEQCKTHIMGMQCLFFCDPNLAKWGVSDGVVDEVPICTDTCNEMFEACKNDKTYSENWLDDFILYRNSKGPIKPDRPCRTFAEIFKNGEGMCNHIYGNCYRYERSSNCMVFDFKGENPNNKVVPRSSSH
ncbi:riboflavin-binding protein-like [Actinia tenebrosa]|uniref:Riboflavin-binding protein-like n=1 Tax=Actinia tenebrosa TaxID=6105 RepID=A0A6P8JGV9_ACTTE|nr:riboflavin-binding protein-like [Actinia tenebrosa]